MARYDFVCKVCGRIEETDDRENPPYCECVHPATQMKRKYMLGGAVFRGSGWYSVDKRKTDGGTIGIDP